MLFRSVDKKSDDDDWDDAPRHDGNADDARKHYVISEVWKNLRHGRGGLKRLTTDPRFSESPDYTVKLDRLETKPNQGNWYGQRIRGYLVPKKSGKYRFWLAADNNAELLLAKNDQPGTIRRIARVKGRVGFHQWQRQRHQVSRRIALKAGKRYYFEILHQDYRGADHLAVAWSRSGKRKQLRIIDSEYLRVFKAPDTGTGPAPNHPPVMKSLADQSVTEGQSIRFNVSASDPDAKDTLTLSASHLPANAEFKDLGQGLGTFFWLPAKGDAGSYTMTFKVQDQHQPPASDSKTMTIKVIPKPNNPPVLAPIGDQATTEGRLLTINVQASDIDTGDQLTLSIEGLPTGANFIDHTDGKATITWIPALGSAGTYPVTIAASDNGIPVATVRETIQITVKQAAGDAGSASCQASANQYISKVHTELVTACSGCHKNGGIGPGFELTNDAVNSFNAINQYAASASDHADLLLSKSIGRPFHGGGSPYVDSSDTRYQQLQALLNGLPCNSTGVGNTNGPVTLQDINLLDNKQTLRKAAIIFAGRLPTAAEIQQVDSTAGLSATVRSLMNGEGFANYIYRAANDWFLNAGSQFDNYELKFGTYAKSPEYKVRQAIYSALRREPLELMRFIVENDRPYSEVVTADYTLVNADLSKLYAAVDANIPGSTAAGWKTARIPAASKDNPGTAYPHAGVLSMAEWLSRFPTTDTNRNRHRVSMMYRQFLAFDIEALGQRPSSDADGGDFLVPVMENPACTACHSFMDPAAGTFMDFGVDNSYRQRGEHALSKEYTQTGSHATYPKDPNGDAWYQPGDKWYRDVFAPGFEAINMPGDYTGLDVMQADNGGQSALSWMTRELVADPRFAKGAVYFWYRSLFGRDPLAMPADPSDTGYAADLEAFNFQHAVLNELAQKFQDNGMVVRDLLVDMVLSPWFRADSVTKALTAQDQKNLAEIGMQRLLTTEELDIATRSVTNSGLFGDYTKGPGLLYGGFDGGLNVVNRNRNITTTMAVVADAAFNELLCSKRLVANEFNLPKAQRRLLKFVERSDVPGDALGRQHILENIQFLHQELLGEALPLNDSEIQTTLALFEEIIANTTQPDTTSAVFCEGTYYDKNDRLRGSIIPDPAGTLRAWNTVLLYFFGDFHYLNN